MQVTRGVGGSVVGVRGLAPDNLAFWNGAVKNFHLNLTSVFFSTDFLHRERRQGEEGAGGRLFSTPEATDLLPYNQHIMLTSTMNIEEKKLRIMEIN